MAALVFPAGNNQFKSPGSYAQDPLSSKQVYCDEVDAMYEYIQQVEQLPFGYNDVAVCMTRVLRRCDGGVARSVKSPFKLAQERVVETGYNADGKMQHETIPGDWMTIPGLDGKCRGFRIDAPARCSSSFGVCQTVNGFFAFIRETDSVRSTAGRSSPATTSTSTLPPRPQQVVFNAELQEAVKVACISPIIDLDALIQAGERPKRSVLLAGPPGTGKTLLFAVAQSLLFEMGMTGVIVPPGGSAQDMQNGLRVARNYMTRDGIVGLFIEDIEKMADKDRALALDNLDGSVSKSDRILIMMTTNFPEIASAFSARGVSTTTSKSACPIWKPSALDPAALEGEVAPRHRLGASLRRLRRLHARVDRRWHVEGDPIGDRQDSLRRRHHRHHPGLGHGCDADAPSVGVAGYERQAADTAAHARCSIQAGDPRGRGRRHRGDQQLRSRRCDRSGGNSHRREAGWCPHPVEDRDGQADRRPTRHQLSFLTASR